MLLRPSESYTNHHKKSKMVRRSTMTNTKTKTKTKTKKKGGKRRKKKTRKKRGKGAIQSYFSQAEPPRDYTWNVAQFNGDYDDFETVQFILELFMRDDDFRPQEEAHHRSVYQRSIIDDYHNPDRRRWQQLLRWVREETIREQQAPEPEPALSLRNGRPRRRIRSQTVYPRTVGGVRRKKKTRKKRKRKRKGKKSRRRR